MSIHSQHPTHSRRKTKPFSTALVDETFIADTLGSDLLQAVKRNDPRAAFKILLERHPDLLTDTNEGALFIARLAVRIRCEDFRDRLAREFGIFTAGRLPAPDGPRAGAAT